MSSWQKLKSLVGGGDAPPDNVTQLNTGTDRLIARKPLWRRALPYALIIVVVLVAGGWMLSQRFESVYRAPFDQITIGEAKRGTFEDFIAVRGAVAPLITAYLTTEQGGTVKQILVEDGAHVKADQPLIILSNPSLQLQVAAQQLSFEQTRLRYQRDLLDIEHQLSRLKSNLERDKRLLAAQAIAQSTYTAEEEEYAYYQKLHAAIVASRDVEQRVRATELTGETRKSGNSIMNAGIEALTIRAPMDGELSALDAEVGQSKGNGSVLGQVNSANRFKLTAQVDEYYLGRVVLGQQARLTINDSDYKAKVAKVYPQVTNGTYKIDLYFDGVSPTGLRNGQAVDMKVELGNAAPALLLPNGSFYQDTGGNWAFVVEPGGRAATRRAVRLGRKNPIFIEVLDGMNPGERVIISGYESYKDMDRVEFIESQKP